MKLSNYNQNPKKQQQQDKTSIETKISLVKILNRDRSTKSKRS